LFNDNFSKVIHLTGVDVIHNSWAVSEFPNSRLDLENMPELSVKRMNKIYKLLGGGPATPTNRSIPPKQSLPTVGTEVNVDDVLALLECLSIERLNDYGGWIQLGICLKCLGLPYEYWDSISRKSYKYKEGECERKYSGLRMTGKSIASLYYWAKQDNPMKLDKIKHTLGSSHTNTKSKSNFECDFIDTPYLLNKPDETPSKEQSKFSEIVDEFKQHKKTVMSEKRIWHRKDNLSEEVNR
jgi:hypothetical protein